MSYFFLASTFWEVTPPKELNIIANTNPTIKTLLLIFFIILFSFKCIHIDLTPTHYIIKKYWKQQILFEGYDEDGEGVGESLNVDEAAAIWASW